MSRPLADTNIETRHRGTNRTGGELTRRPVPYIPGHFHIKLTGDLTDDDPPIVFDGHFRFEIPPDLDGSHLIFVRGFLGTVSGGDIVMMVSNNTQGVDMLVDPVTIEAGDDSSRFAATQPDIDEDNNEVAEGDHIWIDVDQVGDGAERGLGIMLIFHMQISFQEE